MKNMNIIWPKKMKSENMIDIMQWIFLLPKYRGADIYLARPGRKQATFPAFYGTWRFITTFTTVHHLSLP